MNRCGTRNSQLATLESTNTVCKLQRVVRLQIRVANTSTYRYEYILEHTDMYFRVILLAADHRRFIAGSSEHYTARLVYYDTSMSIYWYILVIILIPVYTGIYSTLKSLFWYHIATHILQTIQSRCRRILLYGIPDSEKSMMTPSNQ